MSNFGIWGNQVLATNTNLVQVNALIVSTHRIWVSLIILLKECVELANDFTIVHDYPFAYSNPL